MSTRSRRQPWGTNNPKRIPVTSFDPRPHTSDKSPPCTVHCHCPGQGTLPRDDPLTSAYGSANAGGGAMSNGVGVDDYALVRVPQEARYSWWSVAVQRFGQVSALSQFLLGSTLGFGMRLWNAFWAFTLGARILGL